MSDGQAIRVMLVDDHLLVRDGLKLLLSTFDNLEVVGLAEDGEQAVALCGQLQPDVILMDLVMPNMDGSTATGLIRAEFPQVQVIALTSFVDDEHIQQAIQAGAIGYLLKNASADQLNQAIQAACQGQPTLDPAATQALMHAAHQPPPLGHDLTERERDVLALLVEGKPNKEIAEALTLSPATVRVYVSNILAKLGANNRTEAVSRALQHKLVSEKTDGP
jgi:NarL family two-component system response regulator LiaR